MPSTYTANNLLELIGTGDQSGSWGTTTNTMISTLDRLTKGVGTINMTGTGDTVTTSQGGPSDGHYLVLLLAGSLGAAADLEITPNDQTKLFFVKNNAGDDVEIFQGVKGNGSSVTVGNGKSVIIYCDGGGTTSNVVDLTTSLNAVGTTIQGYNAFLNSIATTGINTDQMLYGTGTNTIATTSLTSFARSLLDDADAATFISTLGITASIAELNYNDVTTLGTSEASKVVTADAGNNVSIGNNLTVTGELQATSYNETYVSVASSSNTTTLDLEAGNVFKTTLTEATTLSFTNPPASGVSNSFTLLIEQDVAGSYYTVTFPSSIQWTRSLNPTLTNSASAVDIFVFFTVDGGTTYYGFAAGENMG